jgi:hypothetical protein
MKADGLTVAEIVRSRQRYRALSGRTAIDFVAS